MKVYLDNNIVSAIAKDDTPKESNAIDLLLRASGDGKVDLVTSEVTLREIEAYQDNAKRRLVERTYQLLAKVPIVRWDDLIGMHSYGDSRTWITAPMIQNDPGYTALLALGLDVVDAQHLFVAIKNACDAFLTCDRSVLRLATEIKSMIVQKPSDFVVSQGWYPLARA
jgi:predicted nucleic acid-binding protein